MHFVTKRDGYKPDRQSGFPVITCKHSSSSEIRESLDIMPKGSEGKKLLHSLFPLLSKGTAITDSEINYHHYQLCELMTSLHN